MRRLVTELLSGNVDAASTFAMAVISTTSVDPVLFTSPSSESAKTTTSPPSNVDGARVAFVRATRNERSLSTVTNSESFRIWIGTRSDGATSTPDDPSVRMVSISDWDRACK